MSVCAYAAWIALLVISAHCCVVDSDCKPATCCHATICVEPNEAPQCTATNCTGCEAFTLDCGGRCFCTELKKCAAALTQGAIASGNYGNAQRPKGYTYTYRYKKVKA
jgi:hypothetical protein